MTIFHYFFGAISFLFHIVSGFISFLFHIISKVISLPFHYFSVGTSLLIIFGIFILILLIWSSYQPERSGNRYSKDQLLSWMKEDNYVDIGAYEKLLLYLEAEQYGCLRKVKTILKLHGEKRGMNLAWDHLKEREMSKDERNRLRRNHFIRLRANLS